MPVDPFVWIALAAVLALAGVENELRLKLRWWILPLFFVPSYFGGYKTVMEPVGEKSDG
ncbi:MAG TPA: hypothetical protein VIY48_21695 [Candidatus Paceibacterota bacterium]